MNASSALSQYVVLPLVLNNLTYQVLLDQHNTAFVPAFDPVHNQSFYYAMPPNSSLDQIAQFIANLTAPLEQMERAKVKAPVFVKERRLPLWADLTLIVCGLSLNLLVAAAILCSDLVNSNANKYVCVILLADSVYIVCAQADLFETRTISFGVCAMQELLADSAAFVSSMTIVLLTVERFLAIVCPMELMQVSDMNRWKTVFCCVFPLVAWKCFTTLLAVRPAGPNDVSPNLHDSIGNKCVTVADNGIVGIDSIVSILFHYLLPLVCVTFLNAIIAFKVHCSSGATSFFRGGNSPVNAGETSANRTSTRAVQMSAASSARISSTPLVLLVIPAVFVLLNTPVYTWRFLVYSLYSIDGITMDYPMPVYWAVYYSFQAHFFTNSVVYALTSSMFRRRIGQMVWPSWREQPTVTRSRSTGNGARTVTSRVLSSSSAETGF